jgi:hypothetical protein
MARGTQLVQAARLAKETYRGLSAVPHQKLAHMGTVCLKDSAHVQTSLITLRTKIFYNTPGIIVVKKLTVRPGKDHVEA